MVQRILLGVAGIFCQLALLGFTISYFGNRSLVNDAAIGLLAYVVLAFFIEPLSARDWRLTSRPVRWSVYYAMVAGILVFARFESRSFIYFQF